MTATLTRKDVRFSIPLYTQAEAARYVDMPASTFRTWAQGYQRKGRDGSLIQGDALITYIPPRGPSDLTVPFIALAESMFLSALRKAGIPLQQIRPALTLVQNKIGVAHALASRQLYVLGSQLLWEVYEEGDLDDDSRRALIVLKDGQYVFREVVERYMKSVEYAPDDYAARVRLPGYEVAGIMVDPEINFGHPFFVATGTPMYAVLSRLRAGEPRRQVADDFELAEDEVAEVADRAELPSAWKPVTSESFLIGASARSG
jgi:uncharacterized protein (DUF433 family)